MTSTRTTAIRAALASLGILAFAAGAAAGVAGDRMLSPGMRVHAIMGDMSDVLDRLDLSPEQRREAEAIISRSAPRSEAIMLELADRLRAVADSVDGALRAILTPDQRLRLDSMKRNSRILMKRKVVTPEGSIRTDTMMDRPLRP